MTVLMNIFFFFGKKDKINTMTHCKFYFKMSNI